MSDSTLELESLLREKEELVEALTERLEQAAEQLDRLKRANGDRGHWLAGGIPAELIEQQRNVCDDLGRVVQQWEESQPTATLSRIEMQLEELRDLIVQGGGPAARHAGGHYHDPRRGVTEEPAETAPSGQSAWDALKASVLAQSGEQPAQSHEGPEGGHVPDGPDPFGEPIHVPPPIDLDAAGADELRKAVTDRDDLIAELLQRLRAAESRTRPSDGWKALETVPDDLRHRLEALERRLEQTQRLTEVELSLERAKLGREAVRLRQLEESTQKAMERVGLAMAGDDEDDDRLNAADGRWLRMLGIKRER